MPAGSSLAGPGFDPDTPVVQATTELAEISTASVSDSVFQVPEGYQSAPAADILKDWVKERMAQAAPAAK